MNNFTINNLPATTTVGNNEADVTEMMIRRAGITDATTQELLISNSSLLKRVFFPKALKKIIDDFKHKSAKEFADFNLRICNLGHEFQVAILTERYNSALSIYKGTLRADVLKAASQRFKEVLYDLNEYQQQCVKEIQKTIMFCAQLEANDAHNPTEVRLMEDLKSQYEASIKEQVQNMFLFHKNALNNFVSFLSEKLNVPRTFFEQ